MPNANFGTILVHARLQNSITKSFFGKETVKYGELIAISGFLTQCGAVLASAFRDHLHYFLVATITPDDNSDLAKVTLTEDMWSEVGPKFERAKGYSDYVLSSEMVRFNKHDPIDFFNIQGTVKVAHATASTLAGDYFAQGLSLGLCNPSLAMTLYDLEHAPKDQAAWALAKASGLNIPRQQDVIPYAEFESTMREMLLEWCKEFRPDLLSHLK